MRKGPVDMFAVLVPGVVISIVGWCSFFAVCTAYFCSRFYPLFWAFCAMCLKRPSLVGFSVCSLLVGISRRLWFRIAQVSRILFLPIVSVILGPWCLGYWVPRVIGSALLLGVLVSVLCGWLVWMPVGELLCEFAVCVPWLVWPRGFIDDFRSLFWCLCVCVYNQV